LQPSHSEDNPGFESIHLLVNNAGVGGGGDIEATSTRDFDAVLKQIFMGLFGVHGPHINTCEKISRKIMSRVG